MTGNMSIQEKKASKAFDKQSEIFDQLYNNDTIIRYKRKRVRDHIQRFLKPSSHILELNAGTGEDAIYFAQEGHNVHATDVSTGMIEKLSEKVRSNKLEHKISYEICSYTELENLSDNKAYDFIFSNFAGLNCTNRLEKVLDSFYHLLNPSGFVTLVILPRFCLWEFLLLFKGKFKTALRRFSGKKGAKAHIEGEHFRCWYYNPSFIQKHLKDTFDVIALEGLCTIVPPSYLENFAEKNPKLYAYLVRKEHSLKEKWPWKIIGDYYIITLQKKG